MADKRLMKHYRFITHDGKRSQPTRSDIEVARRYNRIGPQIYSSLFTAETGLSIPTSYNVKLIAENVFFKSLTDLHRKLKRPDYYRCNAELFLRYMPAVCAQVGAPGGFPAGRAAEYIMQSYALLQRHSWHISRNDFDYGLWKSEHTEYFRLFSSSMQLVNFHPVADINCGSATIRMCIESRIRSALGIFGVFSPKANEMKVVNMSDLFKAMTDHRAEIKFDIDLDLIKLVYSWSNNFIHATLNTFPWLVLFCHDLLKPVFLPTSRDGHFDIASGIRIHPVTLNSIRASLLEPHLILDPKAYIYGHREDNCYVGFLNI